MSKSLRFGGSSEVRGFRVDVATADDQARREVTVHLALGVLIPKASTAKVLRQLLGDAATVKSLRGLFWRDSGELHPVGLGSFAAKGVYDGQRILLSSRTLFDDETQRLDGVTVRKIVIAPVHGHQVAIRFEIEAAVDDHVWGWLRGAVAHGAVRCELVGPQQMDFADDAEHETPEPDDLEDNE